jgi:hypothetical protein
MLQARLTNDKNTAIGLQHNGVTIESLEQYNNGGCLDGQTDA